MAKKYLSKISKDGTTIYVKDEEAREAIEDIVVPENVACFAEDTGEGIIPIDGIRIETKAAAATITANPDVVTVISGSVGTSAITLQVPDDNLAHVWDIILTTGETPAVTLTMSNSGAIHSPAGFAIVGNKSMEVKITGTGTDGYLRYWEFS